MEIRSYRAVFDLERRIYRVDRLRLNPSGVPVRGVAYFLVALLATSILSAAPLSSAVLGGVPWYLRELAAPCAISSLLTVVRIEGRPFHLAASALAGFACTPRRLCGAGLKPMGPRFWSPRELLCLPDGSEPRMRRMRYTGAGAVRVSSSHRLIEWAGGPLSVLLRLPDLTIEQVEAQMLSTPRLIELGDGARMEVRGQLRRRERRRRGGLSHRQER